MVGNWDDISQVAIGRDCAFLTFVIAYSSLTGQTVDSTVKTDQSKQDAFNNDEKNANHDIKTNNLISNPWLPF